MTEEELLSKPPRPYKRLDAAKADRLRAKGYSTAAIGKVLGVDQKTVWRHLNTTKPERQALVDYKSNRADILAAVQAKSLNIQAKLLETLQDQVLDSLKPGEKTGLLMALNAQHGTLFDKERLERGQSTVNQSVHSAMLDQTIKSLYAPAIKPAKPRQKPAASLPEPEPKPAA